MAQIWRGRKAHKNLSDERGPRGRSLFVVRVNCLVRTRHRALGFLLRSDGGTGLCYSNGRCSRRLDRGMRSDSRGRGARDQPASV